MECGDHYRAKKEKRTARRRRKNGESKGHIGRKGENAPAGGPPVRQERGALNGGSDSAFEKGKRGKRGASPYSPLTYKKRRAHHASARRKEKI